MTHFLQAILGVLLISLIPLVGLITLAFSQAKVSRYTHLMVSFAVGALLGNSLLHLLPEIVESSSNLTHAGLLIIAGVLVFFSLEQFLQWHHKHNVSEETHVPVAFMSILGDSVHNFLDGLLIAGSFIVSPTLGWGTVLAVALHELPQEIADFSILLHAKWPIRKIILANILSGLLALAGTLIGFLTHSTFPQFAEISLTLTVGGFLYIACTDLIPDLHKNGAERIRERALQVFLIIVGIALFLFL